MSSQNSRAPAVHAGDGPPVIEAEISEDEQALFTLQRQLEARGLDTTMAQGCLIVTRRGKFENVGDPAPCETISVRQREDDEGRAWFIGADGYPITEVERTHDAVWTIAARFGGTGDDGTGETDG